MIELVDMCSLQDPEHVDFAKMRDSGIRGVYFKSSQYSASKDPTFSIGVKRAKAAGLACGAYHFAYCGKPAAAQMAFFLAASDGLGAVPGELPPMLDWEFAVNGDDGRPLAKSDTVRWAMDAMDEAQELWYPNGDRMPTIYTFPFFAGERQPWLGQCSKLADYPLTLAAYPTLITPPKPWDKVTIHQYIGNGGRVPGVTPDCDRDRFMGSEDDFQRFLGNITGKAVQDEEETGSGGIIHPICGAV